MSVVDSTLSFFLKSFQIRSKEITADVATAEASKLTHFFAVELHYKGTPIRLIVAASAVPGELKEITNPRKDAGLSLTSVSLIPEK